MTSAQVANSADRSEIRTSMFVMATIYAAGASAAVKVRNLSPLGALIEGEVLPPLGSIISLCRGSLSATGTVKWSDDCRAGLQFDVPMNVAQWLPGGEALLQQERVDAIFRRTGALPETSTATETAPSGADTADAILTVKALIDSVADAFSTDEYIIVHFGSKLQLLDLVAQILAKIAAEKSNTETTGLGLE